MNGKPAGWCGAVPVYLSTTFMPKLALGTPMTEITWWPLCDGIVPC